MESVELCEIVRDEDEQDGSVSQLIWRVESWESWRSTYLIVIHARLIRFVKLETAGYIPVPVEKKKISGFIVLTTQYTISRNGRWEEALQLITLIVHKENGVEERQVGF